MSIFDSEIFLPGVVTEIEADYSFGYDTSLFGTTDSQVVIGTAFDGPTGVLTPVYSPEHGLYVFGKTYDPISRQEASLVAGIKDAWERGCRTIYAVRVGGVELYKDFDLCVDSQLKLRVQSASPSNIGKQVYMKLDNTYGGEALTLYKPASRATITEKRQGMVTSDNDVLTVDLRLNLDYGYNRDSKLVDIIRLYNEHVFNNVMVLSLVDGEGNDVTDSAQAHELVLGALFPGVYYMGRDRSLCTSKTEFDFSIVSDETSSRPYSTFTGLYYKKLIINTDISQPVPIYFNSLSDMRDILRKVNITMVKAYDFLEIANLSDRAFAPDEKDYEQVGLSPFEIYRRLGSGFATTAKAERRTNSLGVEVTPRIKETPLEDINRTVALKNGIYSMLENAPMKYRTLVCGYADEAISGRLPRAEDFLTATPEDILVLADTVRITSKISSEDKTIAKKYNFKFVPVDAGNNIVISDIDDIYSKTVMPVIAKVADISDLNNVKIVPGTMLMYFAEEGKGTLIRVSENGFDYLNDTALSERSYIVDNTIYKGALEDITTSEGTVQRTIFKKGTVTDDNADGLYEGKKYILGESLGVVVVYKVNPSTSSNDQLDIVGDLATALKDDADKTYIFAESAPFATNTILVKSNMFDAMTMLEFVEYLNEHEALRKLFTFELAEAGAEKKDDYVTDALPDGTLNNASFLLNEDRKVGWDYSKYIPYKTTDNFARQLAQHCTYTELKTAPTWGSIGCSRITDTSLTSIQQKVDKLLKTEFDLNAKTDGGRNMLDRNNMAYPLGKNISLTFGQYYVTMDDGRRHVSNMASGYGGMVSTLPLDQSSTNQIFNINEDNVQFLMNNYQLTQLTAKGIVTMRKSFTRGIVITDGITMAPADSLFRRLNVSRIIGAIEELIRQAAEPYIGKQNHAANRNALETAIRSKLDKLKNTLIEDYKMNLVVDPTIAKFAYINIDYRIVPIFEIREVRNRITVKEQITDLAA